MKKLKAFAPRSQIQSIEPINPNSRLSWKKGEVRHCEISHIVHLKPGPSNVIAEFHLTPRGAKESKRHDQAERRAEQRNQRYLRSPGFRRLQADAWKAFVLS